jgi:uncharacterized membrane protein YcjF (UPF0283 family)
VAQLTASTDIAKTIGDHSRAVKATACLVWLSDFNPVDGPLAGGRWREHIRGMGRRQKTRLEKTGLLLSIILVAFLLGFLTHGFRSDDWTGWVLMIFGAAAVAYGLYQLMPDLWKSDA